MLFRSANSAITDFAATTSGTPLSSGATSSVGFTVTNLDAGESVIVRVDLRIICTDTDTSTGNVQASLTSVYALALTANFAALPFLVEV